MFQKHNLDAAVIPDAARPVALTSDTEVRLEDVRLHAAVVREELEQSGAVLLRGIAGLDAQLLEALARGILPEHVAYSTGEHPAADGSGTVHKPVTFAPEEHLRWHHEDSFKDAWPRFILFGCATPADTGGETTLVDSRLVRASLRSPAADRLADLGVRYVRHCDGRTSRTWQDLYETSDPAVARGIAAAHGEQLAFDGDIAVITAQRPAYLDVAFGTAWFNQLLHWHERALPEEIRELVTDGLIPAHRTCTYGDGSLIPDQLVSDLVERHLQYEFPIKWERGDVLVFDNERFSHGRNAFSGRREHFVRMAGTQSHVS